MRGLRRPRIRHTGAHTAHGGRDSATAHGGRDSAARRMAYGDARWRSMVRDGASRHGHRRRLRRGGVSSLLSVQWRAGGHGIDGARRAATWAVARAKAAMATAQRKLGGDDVARSRHCGSAEECSSEHTRQVGARSGAGMAAKCGGCGGARARHATHAHVFAYRSRRGLTAAAAAEECRARSAVQQTLMQSRCRRSANTSRATRPGSEQSKRIPWRDGQGPGANVFANLEQKKRKVRERATPRAHRRE